MSASPTVQDAVLYSFCRILRAKDMDVSPCDIKIPKSKEVQDDLVKNGPDGDSWKGCSALRKIQGAIEVLKWKKILLIEEESEPKISQSEVIKIIANQENIEKHQSKIKGYIDKRNSLEIIIKDYYEPIHTIVKNINIPKNKEYIIITQEEKNSIDQLINKDLLYIFTEELRKEWEKISSENSDSDRYKISDDFFNTIRKEYTRYVIEYYQIRKYLCELGIVESDRIRLVEETPSIKEDSNSKRIRRFIVSGFKSNSTLLNKLIHALSDGRKLAAYIYPEKLHGGENFKMLDKENHKTIRFKASGYPGKMRSVVYEFTNPSYCESIIDAYWLRKRRKIGDFRFIIIIYDGEFETIADKLDTILYMKGENDLVTLANTNDIVISAMKRGDNELRYMQVFTKNHLNEVMDRLSTAAFIDY